MNWQVRTKHEDARKKKRLHTVFFFCPGQDFWYILPHKGVDFHHETHLESEK